MSVGAVGSVGVLVAVCAGVSVTVAVKVGLAVGVFVRVGAASETTPLDGKGAEGEPSAAPRDAPTKRA